MILHATAALPAALDSYTPFLPHRALAAQPVMPARSGAAGAGASIAPEPDWLAMAAGPRGDVSISPSLASLFAHGILTLRSPRVFCRMACSPQMSHWVEAIGPGRGKQP